MATPLKQRIKGVLFDLDGTLVDTTYLHTLAWWQALEEHGHVVPMTRIHRAIGMGADKLLGEVLGFDHDTTDDAEITAAHDRHFARWYPLVRPLPGARALLRRCRHAGHQVILATSASSGELKALRDALAADDAINLTADSADGKESKPSPDILLAALTKARLRAQEVVYVGDAVWDVRASAALEIPCIGLECGGTSASELRDAGACETWRDPAELLENFERSVLGSSLMT